MGEIQIQPLNNFPEVKGVFVCGCVGSGHGSFFYGRAHAHVDDGKGDDDYIGWICINSPKRLGSPYKLNQLLIHELAHIITGEGHTKKWRDKMKELGGRVYKWQNTDSEDKMKQKHKGQFNYHTRSSIP